MRPNDIYRANGIPRLRDTERQTIRDARRARAQLGAVPIVVREREIVSERVRATFGLDVESRRLAARAAGGLSRSDLSEDQKVAMPNSLVATGGLKTATPGLSEISRRMMDLSSVHGWKVENAMVARAFEPLVVGMRAEMRKIPQARRMDRLSELMVGPARASAVEVGAGAQLTSFGGRHDIAATCVEVAGLHRISAVIMEEARRSITKPKFGGQESLNAAVMANLAPALGSLAQDTLAPLRRSMLDVVSGLAGRAPEFLVPEPVIFVPTRNRSSRRTGPRRRRRPAVCTLWRATQVSERPSCLMRSGSRPGSSALSWSRCGSASAAEGCGTTA